MNLVRFEPWSLFEQLQQDLNRSATRSGAPGGRGDAVADWVPAVDVVEYPDRFVVSAEVPGVDPAAIELSMDNGVLSIAGERPAREHGDSEGVKRIERASGRFLRRFSLPDSADAEAITARSSHGILEIVIGKRAEVQARRITVEAA